MRPFLPVEEGLPRDRWLERTAKIRGKEAIMRAQYVGILVTIMALMLAGPSVAGEEGVTKSIVDSWDSLKPVPLPSAQLKGLSRDRAYSIQRNAVGALKLKGKAVAGFKAELTSDSHQRKYKADRPLFGLLFKDGRVQPDATVSRRDFVGLLIETEIGFIVGEKIDRPVKDVNALRKKIESVAAVIEFEDMKLADKKNLKPVDLIVLGAGGSRYIVGKRVPVSEVCLERVGTFIECLGGEGDEIQVSVPLYRDGTVVNMGRCQDPLGDQCKALLWLVNSVIKRGWTIEPGYLLLTGPMGDPVPGIQGRYEARFGSRLGAISFVVK